MAETLRGILALMNRSMRTEDRLVKTHVYRGLFVLLSYIMLAATHQSGGWLGAPGMRMFGMMCYLNFFCITVAGISFFAAAITEEKEDMTLGLLKMAGVSSLSLLIGKSMPQLISAMVLITAQLPFTMLAITLGGVSLQQVLAAYFGLIAYLIMVASLALFCSVISQRSRTAGMLTGTTLAFMFFGPFFFGLARGGLIFKGVWRDGSTIDVALTTTLNFVASTSAFTRMGVILQTGFSDAALSWQVGSNIGLGLLLLGLGWLLFEPCTRNEKPASESRGILSKRLGGGGFLSPSRAWDAALVWKDFNFVAGGKVMWIVKLLAYAALLGFVRYTSSSAGFQMSLKDFGQAAMMTGLWAFIIEMGIQSSRIFYTEVKWKTLSSIVLLPKTIGQVAYSKLLGGLVAALPAVCLFVVGVFCAPDSFGDAIEDIIDAAGFWYLASQIFLFMHLVALLSLYLKWGAFPATFALLYGGNIFMMFVASVLMGGGVDESMLILPGLASAAFCIFSHFKIGWRLRELAAR